MAVQSFCRLNKFLEFGWDRVSSTKKYNESHMQKWTEIYKEIDVNLMDLDYNEEIVGDKLFIINKEFHVRHDPIHSQVNIYIRMGARWTKV